MSSISTITFHCARYLADVLSPLIGTMGHHVKSCKSFSENVKNFHVGPDEELGVLNLFASVPVGRGQHIA